MSLVRRQNAIRSFVPSAAVKKQTGGKGGRENEMRRFNRLPAEELSGAGQEAIGNAVSFDAGGVRLLKLGGETGQTRNAPEGLYAPKDASLTILNWNTTGAPPAGQASPPVADSKHLPA